MFRLPFVHDRPLIGIDISDASVEVVVLEQKRGLHVRAYGRSELPPGMVARGIIQDQKKLAESLRGLREEIETQGVRAADAVFAVPEEYIYTRRVALPKKTGIAWRTQAATAVAESVPYDLSAVVWDALLLSSSAEAWEVLCFAVPRSVLEAYEGVLRAAGFRPHLAACNAFALAQAFFPSGVPAPTLVVDIGTTTTILSLFDAQGMYASTMVAVGGQALTQALAAQRGFSLKEAEEIKRAAGFLPDAEQGAVFLLLQKTIQPLVQEAEAFMAEYTERFGVVPMRLVLAGGTALLPGITEYLSGVLDLSVVDDTVVPSLVVSSLSRAPAALWKKTSPLYAVAVGLVLYGFLPQEKHFVLGSSPQGAVSVKQQATMVDTAAPLHTPSSIHRLMARWRVLVLVVFAGLALLLVFLWQRGVFLKIMGRNPSEPVLATSERVITFPVVVSLTATSSVPNALIGSVYDAEEAGEQPVPLSDRYVGKSTGTIRIQNTAVQARVLPAGLLLRTASGTQFVVRDAVTVPARSTSAALFVQAEAEGEQGDIAPQSLSIVDTAAVPQTGLHLSNSTAFSGGAARGTVSLAAITQAKQELTEAVFTKAVRVWEQKKDHLRFFPQDVLERTVVSSSSLALGIMLERDALVRVRVRIRTVSLSEEQLLAAARSVAPAQLDGADAAERYVFSGWELGVGSVDQQNGTATIVVTARATPSS